MVGGGVWWVKLLNTSKRCEIIMIITIKIRIKTNVNINKYMIWNFRLSSMPLKVEKLICIYFENKLNSFIPHAEKENVTYIYLNL